MTPTYPIVVNQGVVQHEVADEVVEMAHPLTDLEADPAVCMTDAASLLERIGALVASREV